MTKTEALKELLKYNLNKLAKNTSIGDLSINFVTVDKFMVLNKDKEVVFSDKLLNYDVDFESQKNFILNVAESVAMTAMILEDLRIEDKNILENYLDLYDKNYIEITGYGPMQYPRYRFYIDVRNFVTSLYDNYCEICEEFEKLMLDTFIWRIKNKIGSDKIRIVIHFDKNRCEEIDIYIDELMEKDTICVGYIDDIKKLEGIDNLKNPKSPVFPNECVLKHKLITLYYSVTNNEELKNAVDFIREILYEYEKLFEKFWRRLKEN